MLFMLYTGSKLGFSFKLKSICLPPKVFIAESSVLREFFFFFEADWREKSSIVFLITLMLYSSARFAGRSTVEQSALLLTQLISLSHLMGAIPADRVAHLKDGGYEAVEGPLQEAPLGPRVWLVAPLEERVEAAAAAAAGGTRSHRGPTIQLCANYSTVASSHSFKQKKVFFRVWERDLRSIPSYRNFKQALKFPNFARCDKAPFCLVRPFLHCAVSL